MLFFMWGSGGKVQGNAPMHGEETIEQLFELSMAAEKTAGDFYAGLARKFSHLPEVSEFWKEMARDEERHIMGLEAIRDSLTSGQLFVPADQAVLGAVKNALKFSVKEMLASVRNLDDAYELAHDLENSEVNTVFEFLSTEFRPSRERKEFVRSQVKGHIIKLLSFFGVRRATTDSPAPPAPGARFVSRSRLP